MTYSLKIRQIWNCAGAVINRMVHGERFPQAGPYQIRLPTDFQRALTARRPGAAAEDTTTFSSHFVDTAPEMDFASAQVTLACEAVYSPEVPRSSSENRSPSVAKAIIMTTSLWHGSNTPTRAKSPQQTQVRRLPGTPTNTRARAGGPGQPCPFRAKNRELRETIRRIAG
jgi:hypothetical protein